MENGFTWRKRAAYLFLSALIIGLDQLTKWIVVRSLPLHTRIPVVNGLFDLTHVQNTGAAFGLFADAASVYRPILLNTVAFAVFVFVLTYAFKAPVHWRRLQTGLACVLGGAVGNLIDRLRAGSVTDFLRFYAGPYEWPSFNVADSAITIGVALLAWDLWATRDEPARPPAGAV